MNSLLFSPVYAPISPPILDKIANGHGGFESGVEDFKLGVWGADRALDSWFGVPSPLELGRLRNAII